MDLQIFLQSVDSFKFLSRLLHKIYEIKISDVNTCTGEGVHMCTGDGRAQRAQVIVCSTCTGDGCAQRAQVMVSTRARVMVCSTCTGDGVLNVHR